MDGDGQEGGAGSDAHGGAPGEPGADRAGVGVAAVADDDVAGRAAFDCGHVDFEALADVDDGLGAEGGDFGGASGDGEGQETEGAGAEPGESVGDGRVHLSELFGGGGCGLATSARHAFGVVLQRLEDLACGDGSRLGDFDAVLVPRGDGHAGDPAVDAVGCGELDGVEPDD